MPNGGGYWRLKYRGAERKEQSFSIDTYPAVSLKEARIVLDEAQAKIAKGINPSAEKQALREATEALRCSRIVGKDKHVLAAVGVQHRL